MGTRPTDTQGVDALHESEVRFRRLAALSADVYWEQDEALRFISFSTSRASHIERSYTDKLIGQTRWQIPYLNMTDADLAAHRARPHPRTRQPPRAGRAARRGGGAAPAVPGPGAVPLRRAGVQDLGPRE